jgi:hypothetical protein
MMGEGSGIIMGEGSGIIMGEVCELASENVCELVVDEVLLGSLHGVVVRKRALGNSWEGVIDTRSFKLTIDGKPSQ